MKQLQFLELSEAEMRRLNAALEMARIEGAQTKYFSQRDGAIANRVRCFLKETDSRRGYTTGPVGWRTRFVWNMKFAYLNEWMLAYSGLNERGKEAKIQILKARADHKAGVMDYDAYDGGTDYTGEMLCLWIFENKKIPLLYGEVGRKHFWELMISRFPSEKWTAESLFERDRLGNEAYWKAATERIKKATEAMDAMSQGTPMPDGAKIETDGTMKRLVVDDQTISMWADVKPGTDSVN